jgi:hypothetical protein
MKRTRTSITRRTAIIVSITEKIIFAILTQLPFIIMFLYWNKKEL